jgi:hypothetical protein
MAPGSGGRLPAQRHGHSLVSDSKSAGPHEFREASGAANPPTSNHHQYEERLMQRHGLVSIVVVVVVVVVFYH